MATPSCFGWTGVASLGVLLVAVFRRPLVRVRPSPWESAWFVPIYVWGLESLVVIQGRCGWHPNCFGPDVLGYLQDGAWIFAVGGGVLTCCLVAEAIARRRGLPARPHLGSVPLPVFAAMAGVAANWVFWLSLFLPMAKG